MPLSTVLSLWFRRAPRACRHGLTWAGGASLALLMLPPHPAAAQAFPVLHIGPLQVLSRVPQADRDGPFEGLQLRPGVASVRCDWPQQGLLQLGTEGLQWWPAAGGPPTTPRVLEACDRCKGIPDLSLAVEASLVLRLRAPARDRLEALPLALPGGGRVQGRCQVLPLAPTPGAATP